MDNSKIKSAQNKAVGGKKKRCSKGKSCSATCITPNKVCLVELSPVVSDSLVNAAKNLVSVPKAEKLVEGVFNEGLNRFKNLVKRVIAKVQPEFAANQKVKPPEESVLAKLDKAGSEGQTKVNGSSAADKVKWNAIEKASSSVQGSGKFGTFITVPAKTLLGYSDGVPSELGVKVGNIGRNEAFILKKLGDAGIGPKLIAAKMLSKAHSSTDSGTVHKGVIAMEIAPGTPLYKSKDVVNGVNIRDAYMGARSKLHKLGIAHNDAHTGNAVIDDRGTVRFVDLGLAQRNWRAALAEAIGGHTGSDFQLTLYPTAKMTAIMDRNYDKVKEELRGNGFSPNNLREIAAYGIQHPESDYKTGVMSKISAPLAKKLINMLYEGIG